MTVQRRRHRWEMANDHFYPGPKLWRCIHCGLQKTTEFEEKPQYRMGDQTWHRFAPPCPPPQADTEQERIGKAA